MFSLWSSVLLLFRYCFTCNEKTKITSVRTRGTLLVVTMKCHNKHIHTWRSQPMVNNTGAGNILLSGAILYTGNTFKRISEMFDSINIPHFSRTLFYSIQKTLLFPTLNSFYKMIPKHPLTLQVVKYLELNRSHQILPQLKNQIKKKP